MLIVSVIRYKVTPSLTFYRVHIMDRTQIVKSDCPCLLQIFKDAGWEWPCSLSTFAMVSTHSHRGG